MKTDTPQGNIRAALETLVKRLEQIHADPAYQGVWTIYQTHCGPYRGPQYADELQKAREALNVYEGPLPASPGTEHLPLEAAPSERGPINNDLTRLIDKMHDAILDTEGSGRPVGNLMDVWMELKAKIEP